MKTAQTSLKFIAQGSLLLASFVFVLWPTRSFQAWLPEKLAAYDGFFLVALILASALAWTLHRTMVLPTPSARIKSSPRSQSPWLLVFAGLFVLQALWNIDRPLGVDENVHGLQMARGDFINEVTPYIFDSTYSTQNHVLSHLASFASLHTFGIGKWQLRAPAILFSLALVGVLFVLGRKTSSTLALGLVFAHLLTNQLVVWYSHSMRGYILSMVITAYLFLSAIRFTQGKTVKLRPIVIAFLLSPFAHIFGGVFALLLWITFCFWLVLNHSELSEKQWTEGKRIIYGGIALLPVLLVMFAFEAIRLNRLGDLQSVASTPHSTWFLTLFGLSYWWQGKFLFLTLFSLLAFSLRKKSKNFSTLFFISTLGFLAITLLTLNVRVFLPRYMLVFLIPTLLFLADSAQTLKESWQRNVAIVSLVLSFVVFPLFGGPAVLKYKQQEFLGFDQFLKRVETATQNDASRCFSYDGKADLASWAQEFYFRSVPTLNENCQTHYVLYFGTTPSSKPLPRVLEEPPHFVLFRAS